MYVASIITQRSGSRVGVVNVAMQCSIGFIYGEDGYVSIYEYEGTKNYMKVRSTKMDENKAQVYGLVLSLVKDVLVCTMANNNFTYLLYQQLYFLSTNSKRNGYWGNCWCASRLLLWSTLISSHNEHYKVMDCKQSYVLVNPCPRKD